MVKAVNIVEKHSLDYKIALRRLFEEPKIVFLWNHCEKPHFGTLFLRVYLKLKVFCNTDLFTMKIYIRKVFFIYILPFEL